MEKSVTRRVTPAGLLLAALLFLVLPLTTASCETPAMGQTPPGSLGTSVTGLDLIRSAEHLDATGGLAAASVRERTGADRLLQMPTRTRVFAIATLLVMLATVASMAIPAARSRAATAAAGALAAVVLLTVTERATADRLTVVADYMLTLAYYLPPVGERQQELRGRIDEVVHTGTGYWVPAAVLVAVAAVNVVVLVRLVRAVRR